MTEETIIKYLASSIDNWEYPYQVPRAFIYGWECDYWTLDTLGNTREFEIKISRADYFKDASKDKHKQCNGANYFYYVCPKGLILKSEVDAKYGLIYILPHGNIQIEKKPRRLHDNKFDDWKMLCNKMFYKWYTIWRSKWAVGEITKDEYFAGFNIELANEKL